MKFITFMINYTEYNFYQPVITIDHVCIHCPSSKESRMELKR